MKSLFFRSASLQVRGERKPLKGGWKAASPILILAKNREDVHFMLCLHPSLLGGRGKRDDSCFSGCSSC